ncbi:MAG: hypothetical protein PHR35_02015 [Kiritimatiellae bacterium]|nr:hypothetical protein [Kiritimatiellia bacterium]
MKPLFPANRVNYILRTYVPHWRFEERLEEIAHFCRETGTRHVMLFPDNHFITWNQLPEDELRREAANLKRAGKRLAAEGIRIGINSCYNQSANRWDHRGHLDFDHWATYADGSCDYNLPCLLDPKLVRYLKRYYTVLAEVGPDYIYVDDDHRYMLQGIKGTWGCACDLHLKKFGERAGRSWTRDQLNALLRHDPEVRAAWIDFLGERLVQLAELIGATVHAVDPRIEVGMMNPCVHCLPTIGHNYHNVLQAFKPVRAPLVRPSIGPYFDNNRNDLVPGLFYMQHAAHVFGGAPCYTPEVDYATGTRFSKSMRVVRLHIMQGLLNRMNNPTICANGYAGDSPFLEPAIGPMLRDERNYFEAVRRAAPVQGTQKGIQFIWHFDSARKAQRPIKCVTDLYWPSFTCHDIFGHLGFAVTYDESPVRLLAGESVRCLDRSRIEAILRGGVILDVHAARALQDLGFGDWLGCRIGDPLTGFASEHLQAENLCGPYANTYIPLLFASTDGVFRLDPGPSARVLSRITDADCRPMAPGTVLHQNSVGGRVALLPYVLPAVMDSFGGSLHMVCYHRRHLLKAIVDWMNPCALPVWVEEPSQVAVQTWDDGKRLTACLINTSLDPTKSLTLQMPGDLSPARVYTISPSGRKKSLSKHITRTVVPGGKARWNLRAQLTAFDPFLLLADR